MAFTKKASSNFLLKAYQEGNISAVLAVLVADIDAPIAKQLTTLGFFQESIKLCDEDTLDSFFQIQTTSKTRIIKSDQGGIGKSRWIFHQHENWSYFPISGSANFRNILKRLTKLELCEGSSLHIDVGHDNEEGNETEIDRIFVLVDHFGRTLIIRVHVYSS